MRLAPPDAPFAIIEKQRGAQRVVALSPPAAALGLTPGMMLADARARVPGLAAFPHDGAADRALLVWLVEACERYSPTVAAAGDDALVMDLTGCLEAAGMSERTIAADLCARLARMGLHAKTALAATPEAAVALARFGADSVERLPVAALDLSGEAHLALSRAGLHTLGDLARRPCAPLAARFGPELPDRLARLLEEQDGRLTPHRTPPPVVVDQRFAEPMATVAPLLGVIEGLAGRAQELLARRGEGGRRFDLALFRTDGHVARLAVDSGRPLRDPAEIARLFEERIEAMADPLDPGFGYDTVRLGVPRVEPLEEGQADLVPDAQRDPPDLTPLLDRLAARFGAQAVRRFAPRDAHLPEYAAALVSPETSGGEWPRPEPGEPPLRPLFLYDPPQRVSVLAEVPDGPPRRFAWRGKQYRVTRFEGPERIAYPWWKHPAGEGPTRDYYRVEDEAGHRFWLFRHGLYGRECDDPAWYLHGLFA